MIVGLHRVGPSAAHGLTRLRLHLIGILGERHPFGRRMRA